CFPPPLPSSGRHLSSLCLYRGDRGGRSTSNRRPLAVYELAYGPVVPPPLPPIEADIRQIAEVYRLENCPTAFGRGGSSIGSLHRFDRPVGGEWTFPCFSECRSGAAGLSLRVPTPPSGGKAPRRGAGVGC